MTKTAFRAGTSLVVIFFGMIARRFILKPARPKRHRMSASELDAAYAAAMKDPAFVADMVDVTRAFDGTSADGLAQAVAAR